MYTDLIVLPRSVTHRERGQALVEFSITSALFVLALAAIVYAAQTGILGERTAISSRMAGQLSSGSTPYSDTSFNATYNAIAPGYESIANQYGLSIAVGGPAAPAGANSQQCQTPTDAANLVNSLPELWASSTTPTFECSQVLTPVAASVGTQAPQIFRKYTYQVSTTTGGHNLFPVAGLSSVETFYAPPTVAMIMQCQPTLGGTVSGSLFPGASAGGSSAQAPLSLNQLVDDATALGMSALTCGPIGDAGTASTLPPAVPAQSTTGGCTSYTGATCVEADVWGDPHYDMSVNGQVTVDNFITNAASNDLLDTAGSFKNPFQISTTTAAYASGAPSATTPWGVSSVTTQVGGSTILATADSQGNAIYTMNGVTLQPGYTYTTADGTGNISIIPAKDEPYSGRDNSYATANALQVEENNDATGAQVTQYIDAYNFYGMVGLNTAVYGYNVNIHGDMPTYAGVATAERASAASDMTGFVTSAPQSAAPAPAAQAPAPQAPATTTILPAVPSLGLPAVTAPATTGTTLGGMPAGLGSSLSGLVTAVSGGSATTVKLPWGG